MVTMINLVALCGSCFGGKKSEPSADDGDDDDTIVACEAPDAEVRSARTPCRVRRRLRDYPCPVTVTVPSNPACQCQHHKVTALIEAGTSSAVDVPASDSAL